MNEICRPTAYVKQNILERNHTKICSPTLTLVPFVSKLVNYLLSCQSLKTYKKLAIKVKMAQKLNYHESIRTDSLRL